MTRSRPLIVVLSATVLLCGAYTSQGGGATSGAKALTAQSPARYHPIPSSFAGFNAPFRKNSWQALTPELHQATASLGPGALRVFGGITANYWNWRTGKFFDVAGVPPALRTASHQMAPIYLSDWADLVREANAAPVFDLNLVTSNLSEQVAMLRAARDLGMPIRWIELGNEIYLNTPLFARRFPTPQAYGRTATRWIQAIKRDFPQAQIAAVGMLSRGGSKTRRQRDWTRRVLKTLHGEDALTFHTYWRSRSSSRRLSGRTLWAVFAAPIRRFNLLHKQGLRELPKGVEAWMTEWTVRPSSILRGRWAHGLSDAEYLLGLLGEPRVRQEDLHALILSQPSGALFANSKGFRAGPATVPFAPTAVGAAFSELHPLLSGGARVRGLTVRDAPRIPGTQLAAVRAVGVQGRGALLLNLTGRQRRVRLAGGPDCDGTLDSVWAPPAARITGQPGELHHQTLDTHGPIPLPAYSVNRLSC
jgi:hypothetical protein